MFAAALPKIPPVAGVLVAPKAGFAAPNGDEAALLFAPKPKGREMLE